MDQPTNNNEPTKNIDNTILCLSGAKLIDNWFRAYFETKERYEEFVRLMILDEAVVSGSFIIQMLLGESWSKSDIDIFIHERKLGIFKEFNDWGNYYTHMGLFLYEFPKLADDDPAWNGSQHPGRYIDAFGNNAITKILNYPPKNGDCTFDKFQIVIINRSVQADIKEFIDTTFDFDMCKNMFYYDEHGCHLTIKNPSQIINKKTGFKICRSLESSLNRAKKYMDRGFKFYDDLDNSQYRHPDARRLFNRLGESTEDFRNIDLADPVNHI